MNVKNIVQSKAVRVSAMVVGIALLVLVIFGGGVAVGLHKAKFSYAWGENYERNFTGGPRVMGMMPPSFRPGDEFGGRGFRNGHGISGTVLSVSGNSVVIKDRNNNENTVSVTDKTVIRRAQDTLTLSDLKKDDRVVIVGSPGNTGTVNADFIRVFNNNGSGATNNSNMQQ